MGEDQGEAGDGGESTLTVIVALVANAGIAVAKGVAGVFLEPVPRHDEQLRSQVRARYGERIAAALRVASQPSG